jgi:AbrB family looped-hinge helix DNA binding protein
MATTRMSEQGRMTLPAEIRRKLGLTGEVDFYVVADSEHDRVILQPAVTVPREDAWAYEPGHIRLLRKALEDVDAGRVRPASEEHLDQRTSATD